MFSEKIIDVVRAAMLRKALAGDVQAAKLILEFAQIKSEGVVQNPPLSEEEKKRQLEAINEIRESIVAKLSGNGAV